MYFNKKRREPHRLSPFKMGGLVGLTIAGNKLTTALGAAFAVAAGVVIPTYHSAAIAAAKVRVVQSFTAEVEVARCADLDGVATGAIYEANGDFATAFGRQHLTTAKSAFCHSSFNHLSVVLDLHNNDFPRVGNVVVQSPRFQTADVVVRTARLGGELFPAEQLLQLFVHDVLSCEVVVELLDGNFGVVYLGVSSAIGMERAGGMNQDGREGLFLGAGLLLGSLILYFQRISHALNVLYEGREIAHKELAAHDSLMQFRHFEISFLFLRNQTDIADDVLGGDAEWTLGLGNENVSSMLAFFHRINTFHVPTLIAELDRINVA